MTEPKPLELPDDWNETSAPWPFTEDDILEDDEMPDFKDE